MRRAVLFLILVAAAAAPVRSQPLVADLSKHLVAITTGFTGSDVLVFGALESKGDVVVVVQGPPADVVVRRKGRVSGIWVNRDSLTFAGAPAFYAIAATGPLAKIVPDVIARQEQIGLDYLRLRPAEGEVARAEDVKAFRAALLRLRSQAQLYPARVFPVALAIHSMASKNSCGWMNPSSSESISWKTQTPNSFGETFPLLSVSASLKCFSVSLSQSAGRSCPK